VRKKIFFKATFISALLFSAAVGTQLIKPVRAETIIVPDYYSTIQDAINAASVGDTVFVRNGTYHGTVVINKRVSLVGESKQATIIDGAVINIKADQATVTGFKVIHGGINLDGSSSVTIKENIILNTQYGICLQHSHQNTISNNIVSQNFLNIKLTGSNENVFLNNVLEDSTGQSLWMSGSNNNYFDNNQIQRTNGFSGLYIDNCTSNLFRRNEVAYSQVWGMYLAFYSTGNIFSENTLSNNQGDFIIHYCAYNMFFHNNFFSSSESDNQDCISTWDDGYPSGGNYWSDYNGTDSNSDGVGDSPYTIKTSYSLDTYYDYGPDQDYYPLITPYEIVSPPDSEISIVSPENKMYSANSIALTLNAGGSTSGITYRLDGKLGIAAGNTTLNWLFNGTHVLTTYATDLNGNLVPSDTVYFTVDATVNESKPPNEWTYDYDLPPIIPPDPVIKILSPTQDEVYNTDNIVLNFTVTEPEEYSELKTRISRVGYKLDPSPYESLMIHTGWTEVPIALGTEKTKFYSINISEISNGPHRLVVSVEALCTIIPRFGVIVDADEGVSFTTKTNKNTNSSSTSPSNTSQPTATPSPEPTPSLTSQPTPPPNLTLSPNSKPNPSPSSIPQETETQPESKPYPTFPVTVASVASITVIGMGVLVYFEKRKKESGGST
jgi:parallel beta-helix repeat protein